ncbi:MAG: polysaccharide deacetylase family protein [Pseudomonadota bacterium]
MRLLYALVALLAVIAVTPVALAQGAESKRIAITFDDAPRKAGALYSADERTTRIIAGLEEAGVEQAAFFVNPGRVPDSDGAEARLAAYVAAGHVIANHTNTHPWLRRSEAATYIADIDDAAAWLVGREGYRAWFRYPFLDEGGSDKAKRDILRAALAERGLVNAYVTVDASDWFYNGALSDAIRQGRDADMQALVDLFIESHIEAARFYDELAIRATGRSPAHVLLLHENDLVALALPELLAALRADGWKLITADEAYTDPIGAYAATYDTPSAGGTLTEQVAWQAELPAPRWYTRNDMQIAEREFRLRVLGEEPEERPQAEVQE